MIEDIDNIAGSMCSECITRLLAHLDTTSEKVYSIPVREISFAHTSSRHTQLGTKYTHLN